MADVLPDQLNVDLLSKVHDFDISGDVFLVALATNAYTPAVSHSNYSDLTNEVAAGGGYSTGGKALTGQNVTDQSGTGQWDADDTVWTSATITARYAFVYNASQGNKTVAIYDFGSDITSTAGNFTVQWHANGLLRIS